MKRNEAEQKARKLAKQRQEWEQFARRYNNHSSLVKAWQNAGFSAQEAIEWEKYISRDNLHRASDVSNNIKQGITLTVVNKYSNKLRGRVKYFSIASFIKHNIPIEEAQKWQTLFPYNINDCWYWIAKGFGIDEVKEWRKYDFDVKDAIEWKNAGFKPNEIEAWKKYNFDAKTANKWKKVGSKYAGRWVNYNHYAKNKFTPKEAKEWVDIGVLKPQEADKWRDAKLAKSTIRKFRKNGITAKTILKLQKIKVKPTKMALLMAEADIGMKSKKDFLNKSKILKRNHCKKINIIHVKSSYLFGTRVSGGFYNVDEYDNKGKCYQFTGELIQRIDRKHGLVKNGDFLYYVTFNKSWREGTTKIGVLKGDGAYSYTTAMGAMKTIPKGKVLFFDD